MSSNRTHLFGIAALLVGAALAGCATPDESVGDEGAGDERYATLDGQLYQCDDTLNTDAACDEWMRADDATEGASANASEGTVNEDGTATIDGRTYECDDTVQVGVGTDEGCDEWHLVDE